MEEIVISIFMPLFAGVALLVIVLLLASIASGLISRWR